MTPGDPVMIPRLTETGCEFITIAECEEDWRRLKELAVRLNCTKDCTEKVAACMQVFGRRAPDVLSALREIYR